MILSPGRRPSPSPGRRRRLLCLCLAARALPAPLLAFFLGSFVRGRGGCESQRSLGRHVIGRGESCGPSAGKRRLRLGRGSFPHARRSGARPAVRVCARRRRSRRDVVACASQAESGSPSGGGWSTVEAEAATPLPPPHGRVRGVPAPRIGTARRRSVNGACGKRRPATGVGFALARRPLADFHPIPLSTTTTECSQGSQLVWSPEQLSLPVQDGTICLLRHQPAGSRISRGRGAAS